MLPYKYFIAYHLLNTNGWVKVSLKKNHPHWTGINEIMGGQTLHTFTCWVPSHAFSHFKPCAVPSPQKISLYKPGTGVSSQSLLHFGGGGVLCWVFIAACGLSLVVASWGYSPGACTGFLLPWLLLFQSTGSRHSGSAAVAHKLSCSPACEIFPDQGSNPCPRPPALALNHWTTREVPRPVLISTHLFIHHLLLISSQFGMFPDSTQGNSSKFT